MRSTLDQWAREHKRQRLKELRSKKQKWTTATASAEFMRIQLQEESLMRRILPPGSINDEDTRKKIVEHLVKRLQEIADELGPVG